MIFGVAPTSLKILGQKVTENTQREIGHSLAGLEPALDVHVEYVDIPEKLGYQIIAMYFDGFVWGRVPYTFYGCPYYRVESTTKVMPREMFEESFRGTDKNEFIDNQRVDGNFFDLLDAGMAFFFKHLSLSGKIVGLYREEHLEVPVEALREALTNALCHRQWEKYNLTIGIAIYDDRIEIENPGLLPPQLTPETIRNPHISYPYNPIMTDVLFKTTFLENWGSGAGRIIGACCEQNVPEPEWRIQGGFVIVTFKRPGYKVDRTSTGQVQQLLEIIGNNEFSLKDMMTLMRLKHRENFLDNYLNPAIRSGFVEPLYLEQPNHPKQKYRLTEIGKIWQDKMRKNIF